MKRRQENNDEGKHLAFYRQSTKASNGGRNLIKQKIRASDWESMSNEQEAAGKLDGQLIFEC
jgi:hypothetical protein